MSVFGLKFNKKEIMVIFIIPAFFLIIGLIMGAIWSQPIKKHWDEKFFHKNADVHISINQVFVLNVIGYVNLSNELEREEFVRQLYRNQLERGIVPLPFDESPPLMIKEPFSDTTSCLYKFHEKGKIPILEPRIPDIDKIEMCGGCVFNLVYGENLGNKLVDFINVEFIFNEKIFINETEIEGKDLELCNDDHCIRLKRFSITNHEKFLGSFSIKKSGSNVFDDWDLKINGSYGINDWGVVEKIPEKNIDHTLSVLVPNCTSDLLA